MVFAASYRTPEVFFLQNNQWAISVPVATQSRSPLHRRGAGYGIPSIPIDGNDVLASYAVTRVALDEARSGAGPRAIEAMTYRMGAHTTSDDPTKYRTSDEEESWARRDPIARMHALPARPRGVGRVLRRGRGGGGRGRRRRAGAHERARRRCRPISCSTTCTASRTLSSTSSAHGWPSTRHPSRRGHRERRFDTLGDSRAAAAVPSPLDDRDDAVQPRAQRRAASRHGRERPRAAHGRGHRPPRRGVPGHRGAAGRVRRPPRAGHAAGRVGDRRHGDRTRDGRIPSGVRDPVRRIRLPRLRSDHLAAGQDHEPARGRARHADRDPHPLRRAHRRGRAPPGEPGGVLHAHARACAWSARRRRTTRTG